MKVKRVNANYQTWWMLILISAHRRPRQQSSRLERPAPSPAPQVWQWDARVCVWLRTQGSCSDRSIAERTWRACVQHNQKLHQFSLKNHYQQVHVNGLNLNWKIRIVLRAIWRVPFGADFCAGPDVVFGGEHKLVVQHPFGLVIQTRRRVDVHCLIVLHCQVEPAPLQMRHLQKHIEVHISYNVNLDSHNEFVASKYTVRLSRMFKIINFTSLIEEAKINKY